MCITKAHFGIDIRCDTQLRKVDGVYAAVKVFHTASERKVEQPIRQRYPRIHTLHDIEMEVPVFFYTEAKTEKFGTYVSIHQCGFAERFE